MLKYLFPRNRYYDLLKGEVYERFNRRPELLREELMTAGENELINIDEVQKIPALMDEVHWLINNRKLRFILCGSSARKLKRSGANLLGGRAVRNTVKHLNILSSRSCRRGALIHPPPMNSGREISCNLTFKLN